MTFITQLRKDISDYKLIQSNAQSFIKHKQLRLFQLPKREAQEQDLPIESIVGDIYLIKGNNIIQFYSYWEHVSHYIQVNRITPMWLCKTDIINVEPNDPDHIEFLLDGCEVLTNVENIQYSILGFLHAGFKIYLK